MRQACFLNNSSEDQLYRLARVVVAQVRPNRADREGADDCFQAAYLAGLLACRSARRLGKPTSQKILKLAMRQAVYRLLRRAKRTLREADLLLV